MNFVLLNVVQFSSHIHIGSPALIAYIVNSVGFLHFAEEVVSLTLKKLSLYSELQESFLTKC